MNEKRTERKISEEKMRFYTFTTIVNNFYDLA